MIFVLTAQESNILLEEIDFVLSSLFKIKDKGMESALIESPNVRKLLEEEKVSMSDPSEVKKFLTGLREDLGKTEKASLTLAFYPAQKFIDRIKQWIKDNVGQSMLLDISYDPGILGGIVFIYKGIYKDLSINQSLDKYFAQFKNVSELPR